MRKPTLVVALGLGIEPRETPVAAVLGKYPVERSGSRHRGDGIGAA